MIRKPWMYPLKKAIAKVTERTIWEYNPDAYHPRIPGQFGSEAMVFGKKFNHLIICIDVSGPADFEQDYAEIIDYLEYYFKGVHRRFRRVHINFWTMESHVAEPIKPFKRDLLEQVKQRYEKITGGFSQNQALASAMVEPFISHELWSKLKPDLLLVLTRGKIENDLKELQLSKLRRFKKETVWVCVSDSEKPDLAPLLSIGSFVEKRIVEVVNEPT